MCGHGASAQTKTSGTTNLKISSQNSNKKSTFSNQNPTFSSQELDSGLIPSGFCTIWFVYRRHIPWSSMFSSLIFNVFLSHLLVNGVESILNLEYVTYVRVHALDRKNLGPGPTQIQIWGMQKNRRWVYGHVSTAYLLFIKYSFDLWSRGRWSVWRTYW